MNITIHKSNASERPPKVSIILLDWSVRERFQALEWLPKQAVPREDYELIWVELYNRLEPDVMAVADVVITCSQKGQYHKHLGYNVGLLQARGQIITICDSDAVFPPNFIESILNAFRLSDEEEAPVSQVLMHYQWRTKHLYPDGLSDVNDLSQYEWLPLWPNVGACMSVRISDAIRLGGFDEHTSLRGYMCGPYDLGWRLVNAGLPEVWHDESVALWHFAHPDPVQSFGQKFSFKLWREISYPHLDGHALTCVEALATGRLLPLKENPQIYNRRLGERKIGTKFEEHYAHITGPQGFSTWDLVKLRLKMLTPLWQNYLKEYKFIKQFSGVRRFRGAAIRYLLLYGGNIGLSIVANQFKHKVYADTPQLLVENYSDFNIVLYKERFYVSSQSLGPIDLDCLDEETVQNYQSRGLFGIADSFVESKYLVDRLIEPVSLP